MDKLDRKSFLAMAGAGLLAPLAGSRTEGSTTDDCSVRGAEIVDGLRTSLSNARFGLASIRILYSAAARWMGKEGDQSGELALAQELREGNAEISYSKSFYRSVRVRKNFSLIQLGDESWTSCWVESPSGSEPKLTYRGPFNRDNPRRNPLNLFLPVPNQGPAWVDDTETCGDDLCARLINGNRIFVVGLSNHRLRKMHLISQTGVVVGDVHFTDYRPLPSCGLVFPFRVVSRELTTEGAERWVTELSVLKVEVNADLDSTSPGTYRGLAVRGEARVVNPRILASGFRARTMEDPPEPPLVCENGATDVTCQTEIYHGCYIPAPDCADNDGNPDDKCCAGNWYGGPGDNIDHASCRTDDAPRGSTCFFFDCGHTEVLNDDPGGCWIWG